MNDGRMKMVFPVSGIMQHICFCLLVGITSVYFYGMSTSGQSDRLIICL